MPRKSTRATPTNPIFESPPESIGVGDNIAQAELAKIVLEIKAKEDSTRKHKAQK